MRIIIISIFILLLSSVACNAIMVDEVKEGSGDYVTDTPVRNSLDLNAVQQAWNESDPRESIKTYAYDQSYTIKILIREYMETTIVLPKNENVSSFTWGDKVNFYVMKLLDGENSHILKVAAKFPDADTNLTVFGDSGNIYSFYIRVHSVDSKYLPHLVVYVTDSEIESKISANVPPPKEVDTSIAVVTNTGQEKIEGEYLRELQVLDPAKLNFKYMW